MPQVDDFLKPESMITPGISGAIVMMITNTLWQQFGVAPRWCALALSFIVGSVVFRSKRLPWVQRAIYYTFNSLIVFSMAMGTNALGVSANDDAKTTAAVPARGSPPVSLRGLLVPAAWAQEVAPEVVDAPPAPDSEEPHAAGAPGTNPANGQDEGCGCPSAPASCVAPFLSDALLQHLIVGPRAEPIDTGSKPQPQSDGAVAAPPTPQEQVEEQRLRDEVERLKKQLKAERKAAQDAPPDKKAQERVFFETW